MARRSMKRTGIMRCVAGAQAILRLIPAMNAVDAPSHAQCGHVSACEGTIDRPFAMLGSSKVAGLVMAGNPGRSIPAGFF